MLKKSICTLFTAFNQKYEGNCISTSSNNRNPFVQKGLNTPMHHNLTLTKKKTSFLRYFVRARAKDNTWCIVCLFACVSHGGHALSQSAMTACEHTIPELDAFTWKFHQCHHCWIVPTTAANDMAGLFLVIRYCSQSQFQPYLGRFHANWNYPVIHSRWPNRLPAIVDASCVPSSV